MSADFLSKGVSNLNVDILSKNVSKSVKIPAVLGLSEYVEFDYKNEYSLGDGDLTKESIVEVRTTYKPLSSALLSQIQFLTCYWNGPEEHPNPIVLYVSMSALDLEENRPQLTEGNELNRKEKINIDNIILLSELFPSFKFHIYSDQDLGNKFKNHSSFVDDESYVVNDSKIIGDLRKIIVHRKSFTSEDAKLWNFGKILTPTLSSKPNKKSNITLFLMFDFTTDPTDNIIVDQKNTLTHDEVNNINWSYMLQQSKLYNIISPFKSMLKFVLPKPTIEALSIKPNKGKTRNYLEGVIFKKPWDASYSKETILVPYENKEIEWNIVSYDHMMNYQNCEKRSDIKYLNIINNSRSYINGSLNLYNDFDSTLTVCIITDYLQKFSYPDDPPYIYTLISKIFNELSEVLYIRGKKKT